MEERLARIEKRLEALETKGSASRKEIYDRLRELETATALQNERYDRILDELDELKSEIKKLTEQPQKRWDTAVAAAITAIIGGVIGFVVSKFGGM